MAAPEYQKRRKKRIQHFGYKLEVKKHNSMLRQTTQTTHCLAYPIHSHCLDVSKLILI